MSKKYYNVKLNNGKEVTVKSEKDTSYSVYGGHNYESLQSLKSDQNLNNDTPSVPSFMNPTTNK